MRRYVVTADRDPKEVGVSAGFRIESVTEYDPQTDRMNNISAEFDLTEVYADDLRRLRQRIGEIRGVPVDQIEIDLV